MADTGAGHTAILPNAPGAADGGFALPSQFHWLDFSRFVAAMVVVLHHYYFLHVHGRTLTDSGPKFVVDFPAPFMDGFFEYGKYAVQFFWVLSGFVFAHTYFARPQDGLAFAVARFGRLYPLHFLTLMVVAALQWASNWTIGSSVVIGNNDAYHFLLQLFMVSAWGLENGDSFNAPIWSVSAEIAVYIAFFVLMAHYWFRTVAGQVACILLPLACYGLIGPSAIFACAIFFFAGNLTYLLVAKGRPADFALAAAASLCVVLLRDALRIDGAPTLEWIPIFSAAVYLLARLDVARLRGGAMLGSLGDITYSIYLIHTPLLIAAVLAMELMGIEDRRFLAEPALVAVYVCVVVGIAIPVYHRFERPLDRKIREAARRYRLRRDEDAKKLATA